MKCENYCQKFLAEYLPKIDTEKQGVCIEVGVGTFAFYCVLFAQLGYQTIAIEPLVGDQLRNICQQNKIDLLESCLSDVDGEQTLYIGSFQGNQNTNLSSLVPDWWGASSQKVTVPSLSFNSLISDVQIKQITCLKIDVEGAEVIILRQLKQISSSVLPEVVMFEYGGGDSKESANKGWSAEFVAQTNECLTILKECGYLQGIIIDESDVENPVKFSFSEQLDKTFDNLFKSDFQWGNIIVSKQPIEIKNDNQIECTRGEINVINQFIKNKFVVFDVGANVGNWSQAVLNKHQDIQLHLFEPVPDNYNQLTSNMANRQNVYCQQLAISNRKKLQTFYYYEDSPAWSTFFRRLEVEKQYNLKPPVEIQVKTQTLDSYCEKAEIKRINFLKIDVEGGELNVLYGAKKLLEKGKIDYVQFEYGGTFKDSNITLQQVFDYVQKFRYSLWKINENNLVYWPEFLSQYENFEYSNFLLVNERFKSILLGEKPQMLSLDELCVENKIKPKGIIHIGAHEGKELQTYLKMGVEQILFIEANPVVFERLKQQIANYPNVKAVCCAIGNKNGTATLHVTSMDQSSSILPLKVCQEIYPTITETQQITVTCKTLDTLLEDSQLDPAQFNLINIDIQGAELLAFEGAQNTLKYIEAINTEINYEELYAGCALIDEIDNFLDDRNFKRIATTTPYHPSWGDAFYIKKPVITMSTLGNNGRFANQIFQYAFLKIYAKENNLQVETPTWIGQTIFGHNDSLISQKLPVFYETNHNITEAIIPNTIKIFDNVDFWGYFQYNTRYYEPYKNYFRSLFEPKGEAKEIVTSALKNLQKRGKTLVGIHLRRGDYGYKHFFVAPNQWYLKWLKEIWSTLDEPVLFIASDEIDKVKDDFSDYNPVTVQDLDCELPQANFYPDFYLLSQCDVLAISNSSFSFASSMLNQKANIFMRPNLAVKKLIPFEPWASETLFREDNVEDYQQGLQSAEVEDNWQLTTPVAMLVFNRPDTTQKVFEAIRQAKPPKLLVVADGAREEKEGEAELCEQTKAVID